MIALEILMRGYPHGVVWMVISMGGDDEGGRILLRKWQEILEYRDGIASRVVYRVDSPFTSLPAREWWRLW